MTTEVTLVDLNTAVGLGATDAAPNVTNNWNGSLGRVNLAKPRDYTGDWGKLVKVNNHFSLRDTLEYYLWLAQEKPDADTALTQAHIDKAIPWFRNAIARFRIYAIFHKAGIAISYRGSDMIDNTFVDDAIKKTRACRELVKILTEEIQMEEKIASEGRMILLSIVANAIHREQNADHSWFTEEMKNPRSPTSKACTVAGVDVKALTKFMEANGHDGNHHLSFITIDKFAKILCKEDDHAMGDNTAHPNPIMYAGEDIRGKTLSEIFDLGEAVKGRYPAGILGKAAIIIGMEMTEGMLAHLSTRVKLTGHGGISSNAKKIGEQVAATSLAHSILIEVGRAVGPLISIVYGFSIKSKLVDEEEYQAFCNHAKRHPASLAIGKSLATTLARVAPHREAIEGAIVTALTTIHESLGAAAGTVVTPAVAATAAGAAAVPAVPLLTNVTTVDLAKVKAEVGKQRGDGDVFYDAMA